MLLSNFVGSRDNNFNLIRFIAAMAVLFSHSIPLTTGDATRELFRSHLNMTIGGMAVDVFFLTSGFLVTASLLNRRSAIDFVCARALRIFPALWTMLIVVTLILGGSLTKMPFIDYVKSGELWAYLGHAASLIDIKVRLPGLFEGNPFGPEVNGSLWTLPYEVGMYGILLGSWLVLRASGRYQVKLLEYAVISIATLAGLYILVGYFRHGLPEVFELHDTYRLPSLLFMFFCGGSFYVFRQKVKLIPGVAVALFVMILVAAVNKHSFYVAYLVGLPYVLFCLAFLPGGRIRAFNRLGDYSYGIYIYAFPVQQALIHLLPDLDTFSSALLCALVTLLLSAMSWNFIEEKALDLKASLGHKMRSLLPAPAAEI